MQVGIYWNLKKGGFSICLLKSAKTRGTVIAHASSVDLVDVVTTVSESGRLRSVTKAKEVHAWLAGNLASFEGELTEAGQALFAGSDFSALRAPSAPAPQGARLRYNPHRAATFTTEDGAPCHGAPRVACRIGSDGKAILSAH